MFVRLSFCVLFFFLFKKQEPRTVSKRTSQGKGKEEKESKAPEPPVEAGSSKGKKQQVRVKVQQTSFDKFLKDVRKKNREREKALRRFKQDRKTLEKYSKDVKKFFAGRGKEQGTGRRK